MRTNSKRNLILAFALSPLVMQAFCCVPGNAQEKDAGDASLAPTTTEPATVTQPSAETPVAPPPPAEVKKMPPPGFQDAVKLYSSGKYALAAQKFEDFIKFGVADDDKHMYLGACDQQLKKYDLALKQYDWVAKNAKEFKAKRQGEMAARKLRNARAGICPGKCLKLSTPGWRHVAGLDPNLLWMRFSYPGGYTDFSTHHLGEVIEYVNGEPVSKGPCPICGGTGKVDPLK